MKHTCYFVIVLDGAEIDYERSRRFSFYKRVKAYHDRMKQSVIYKFYMNPDTGLPVKAVEMNREQYLIAPVRGRKGGKMTITSESLFNTDIFEVVDKIPNNYFVWNIGDNMKHDNYIPICEAAHPEDKDDFTIKTDTLKAVRLDAAEVQKLRDAAGYGVNSLVE